MMRQFVNDMNLQVSAELAKILVSFVVNILVPLPTTRCSISQLLMAMSHYK